MRRARFVSILVGAMVCTALITTGAVAKNGGGGGGGGGGDHGNRPDTEVSNNLSVPAIFVPSTAGAPGLNFACGDVVDPTTVTDNATVAFPDAFDNPLAGMPAGDYYIQGEDKWQASCATATAGTVPDGETEVLHDVYVDVGWGDNLVGAPLKVGTPIRVEVGLLVQDAATLGMTGYTVRKLTNELDRLATYGTRGTGDDTSAAYAEVRAWDTDATFSITGPDGTVVAGPTITAEINATGRVVYGYLFKTQVAGTYTLTFNAPNVGIGTAASHVHSASLNFDVNAKGGGGGGGED